MSEITKKDYALKLALDWFNQHKVVPAPEIHADTVIAALELATGNPKLPTCQVQLIGGEVQTMTREAAKALQAETNLTHDWFWGYVQLGSIFDFDGSGVYTYRPKQNLVKLDGELMSREAAIAKATSKKLTHDVWYKYEKTTEFEKTSICFNAHTNQEFEYQLRPKAKKVISWSSLPVGIAVVYKGINYIYQGDTHLCTLIVANRSSIYQAVSDLTLAPASEQPWLNWRGGECPVPEGIRVEVTYRDGSQSNELEGIGCAWRKYFNAGDIIEYRIVGIESGYELGGN